MNYEPYTASPPPPPPRTRNQLTRSRHDKMVGGVCGGLAEFSGIDATLLRVLVVAATIFGIGTPVLVYLIAWLLMPQDF